MSVSHVSVKAYHYRSCHEECSKVACGSGCECLCVCVCVCVCESTCVPSVCVHEGRSRSISVYKSLLYPGGSMMSAMPG